MFTGIIRHIGIVEKIEHAKGLSRLTISAGASFLKNKKTGDSIAVDGACLTVTKHTKDNFTIEAIPETLRKTIIKSYKIGTKVHLENPLKIGDALDGHFVQGHVDFVGTVKKITTEGKSKILTIQIQPAYQKYFATKGSVTLNGVSLTVSHVGASNLEVSLIPETLKKTNLSNLKPHDTINIEIDILSRYFSSYIA